MKINLSALIKLSDDRAVDERFVESAQFVADDCFAGGETVEGDLREEMVFSLILHSAHKQQPEQIFVFVVSAGDDLVVDEGHFRVDWEPFLFFVVADEYEGGVEAGEEFADDPVEDVGSEDVEAGVVGEDEGDVELDGVRGT